MFLHPQRDADLRRALTHMLYQSFGHNGTSLSRARSRRVDQVPLHSCSGEASEADSQTAFVRNDVSCCFGVLELHAVRCWVCVDTLTHQLRVALNHDAAARSCSSGQGPYCSRSGQQCRCSTSLAGRWKQNIAWMSNVIVTFQGGPVKHVCPCRTSGNKGAATRGAGHEEEEEGRKEKARSFLMNSAHEKLSEAFQGLCAAT